jgi:predicted metal-binding membrane protein
MNVEKRLSARGVYWLAFFTTIFMSWWWLYSMSLSMNVDLLGRGMNMDMSMSQMKDMAPMDGMAQDSKNSHDGKADKGGMASGEDMSGMEQMPNSEGMETNSSMPNMAGEMKMDMPMTRFLPLFGMWAVMMAAMMLPTMVPTLRSYEDLMISADGTRSGWIGLLLGYSVVWLVFAAVITLAQLGLLALKIVDMMGLASSIWISVALLILAGAYQFTRAKAICHGVCHSPMMYFIGYWKSGFSGGLRMGLGLGAFCAGCCWLFMVLGFAGGVMNFLWMGLATLFMVIEKLPEIGHRVIRPMGAVLIIAGVGLGMAQLL